jgi:hypothetical protein
MNIKEAPVLTVNEAAEHLWIPKLSLCWFDQEGKAPSYKVGHH